MDTKIGSNEVRGKKTKRFPITFRSIGVRAFLCVVIIVFGVIVANYLIRSAPKASRRPPAKMTPLVRVQAIYPSSHTVVIRATGTVIPAQEMVLRSPVSGEIVKIHPSFSEGGFLLKGTEVLKIDDTDYQLIVAQKQNAVVNARYALKLESGYQEVAKREWALLNGGISSHEDDAELALRKPHLEKAESDLRAAEADLAQAELDLERTSIRTPFNAVVRAAHVEIGSQVASQESLAELVGTDEYWIKASVPVDHLRWITVPRDNHSPGAPVQVFYRSDGALTGTVVRLLGDLETEGRMARVLISVKDPLGPNTPGDRPPPLLLGEYVRVAIEGRQVHGVYRIPRTALRDNTHVWIADEDRSLRIREVETLWRDRDTVLLKDRLKAGDLLIVSDLSTPVDGMPVKIEDSKSKNQPSETEKHMAEQGSIENDENR
jgi:RND family efflux transporter MFP subunit